MIIFNLFKIYLCVFSASNQRWNILQIKLAEFGVLVLKKLSNTRLSARSDAVLALKEGYKYVKEVLIKIYNNESEKKIIINEAKKLANILDQYDTTLITVLWNRILQRINTTSLSLQSVDRNLFNEIKFLRSFGKFIEKFRE